jgi:esterase/lipase superfamily enzyme
LGIEDETLREDVGFVHHWSYPCWRQMKPYFNSPYEYLPNTTDPWKYNHMSIIIGTGEWDNTRHESYRLSEILNSKGIKHWLDDGKWRGHDWTYWQDMLPYYLSIAV